MIQLSLGSSPGRSADVARVQNSFLNVYCNPIGQRNQSASAPPDLWPAVKYFTAGLDFKPGSGAETVKQQDPCGCVQKPCGQLQALD